MAGGEPDLGYPERWSVVRWIDGGMPYKPVGPNSVTGELARDLAGVVGALGNLAVPADALADSALRWYRGGPLAAIDAAIRQYLADLPYAARPQP